MHGAKIITQHFKVVPYNGIAGSRDYTFIVVKDDEGEQNDVCRHIKNSLQLISTCYLAYANDKTISLWNKISLIETSLPLMNVEIIILYGLKTENNEIYLEGIPFLRFLMLFCRVCKRVTFIKMQKAEVISVHVNYPPLIRFVFDGSYYTFEMIYKYMEENKIFGNILPFTEDEIIGLDVERESRRYVLVCK